MRAADPFNLERFVTAQAPVSETVLAELRAGRKRSHWMWFVFPQLAGLGRSSTARFYGIGSPSHRRCGARASAHRPRYIRAWYHCHLPGAAPRESPSFILGPDTYRAAKAMRHVYRQEFLQPLLVALFLSQVASGVYRATHSDVRPIAVGAPTLSTPQSDGRMRCLPRLG